MVHCIKTGQMFQIIMEQEHEDSLIWQGVALQDIDIADLDQPNTDVVALLTELGMIRKFEFANVTIQTVAAGYAEHAIEVYIPELQDPDTMLVGA